MGGVLKGVGGFMWGQDDDNVDPRSSIVDMARPGDSQYYGLTDDQGNLQDKYKLSNGDQYTQLAQNRLTQDLANSRDRASMQGAGNLANARNQMASRGGLSGGAAALLNRQSMTDQTNAQQGITGQGLQSQQNIGEKQFDIGREAEKTNLSNLIGDRQGLNSFNQNKYNQQMAEWAANQSANAMARNAPHAKGGVLGGITQGIGSTLGK